MIIVSPNEEEFCRGTMLEWTACPNIASGRNTTISLAFVLSETEQR
jgi:hypothetical protein